MKKTTIGPQVFATLGALWLGVAGLLADRIEFIVFGGAGLCFTAALCICINESRSPCAIDDDTLRLRKSHDAVVAALERAIEAMEQAGFDTMEGPNPAIIAQARAAHAKEGQP